MTITPIHIPDEWDDNDILLFEEFCTFIRTRPRTVRCWRVEGRGPCWWRFNGNGRLYTTVAEPAGSCGRAADPRHSCLPMSSCIRC
ncbi:hypothetical protein [Nocardioides sp. KR10-350]|uniref:hypothetical protein n=1 Tax=Nocardioides cheoyonin TaxID=3156615 RepID=UPI0032B56921